MPRLPLNGRDENHGNHTSHPSHRFGALTLGPAELRLGQPIEAARWLDLAANAPVDLVFCRIPALASGAVAALRLEKREAAVHTLRKAEREFAKPADHASWIGRTCAKLAVEKAKEAVE